MDLTPKTHSQLTLPVTRKGVLFIVLIVLSAGGGALLTSGVLTKTQTAWVGAIVVSAAALKALFTDPNSIPK